ncbi:MAG: hypothetical protein WCO26_07510 [Deltaproteobacteria bacterium]
MSLQATKNEASSLVDAIEDEYEDMEAKLIERLRAVREYNKGGEQNVIAGNKE